MWALPAQVRILPVTTYISYKNLVHTKNKRVVIGLEILNPTAHNFGLLYILFSGRGGVVIGHDSKSCRLCSRRFESCRPRLILHKNLFFIKNKRVVIGLEISNLTAHNIGQFYFIFCGRAGVVNGHD